MRDLAMPAALSSTLPTANLSTCANCGAPVRDGVPHECKPGLVEARQLRERFTTIYADYMDRVTGYLSTQVRGDDRHLAEDLAAETFTRAWLSLHQVHTQDDSKLFSWLRTIAWHVATDHYRVARNTRETATDTGHWSFANRALDPADGYYTPAATGFRTAQIGDSDPDPDEALRRARQTKPRALAGAR